MKDREKEIFETLKGKYKHYCPEWDYMAIDETHGEFTCCQCFSIPDDEREQINSRLELDILQDGVPRHLHIEEKDDT